MKLREIAAFLGQEVRVDAQVAGYQIDSREVRPGDLFFAIRGQKVDGHDYLGEVKAKGGVGAVVRREYEGPDWGLILLRVEDVAESLQELARNFLGKMRAKIVGVTGSVGKTTTKEFIAALLEGKFRVGKNLGSCNTKLTLPLTILNFEGNEEVLVLEMGMTEPGDITRLLEVAVPDVAVLTRVVMAHVVNFPGGVAQIASEKAEIFKKEKTKVAIFDQELYAFPKAIAKIAGEKRTFSMEEERADLFGGRCPVELPFKQRHFQHNLLGAILVARELGMEWEEIGERMGALQLPKMRFEQFEKNGVTFVNDAYNANPESMRAALSNVPAPKKGGKRIAVLGMMVELGSYSEAMHREVGRFAGEQVDHLLSFGKEATATYEAFAETGKPAEQFFDYGKLAKRIGELASPGDVVLVKASRSVKMEKLFEELGSTL